MVIIGGGGGMVILLVLILVFGFPVHKAVGTSVMVEIGSSLSGFLGYIVLNFPNLHHPLFAMLSGIFGLSILIISLFEQSELPKQYITEQIPFEKNKLAKKSNLPLCLKSPKAAKINAPNNAPAPAADISIPKPLIPTCKISCAKTGMSIT